MTERTALQEAAESRVDEYLDQCRTLIDLEGMPINQVAEMAEMGKANLASILRGEHRPSAVSLFKLCYALGVPC